MAIERGERMGLRFGRVEDFDPAEYEVDYFEVRVFLFGVDVGFLT